MADGTSATERDAHREPAVRDWPSGVAETSVWPFLTAGGVGTIYLGAVLVLLGIGADAVLPWWPGLIVFLGGVAGFLTGLFGWLYHAFVAEYWHRGTDEHDRLTLRTAMVLFLGTEIATFGGGFAYYFYVRAGAWPVEQIPSLVGPLVVFNTVVLLVSSVTMHVAHHGLREGNRARFLRMTGATLVLGVIFLLGQVYEYYEFVVHEGYTLGSGFFASAFYGLTGLHGLHMALAVVIVAIVFVRGWRLDQFSDRRTTAVSTASMYWHFVDAVWLFLVVSLYVGGSLLPR